MATNDKRPHLLAYDISDKRRLYRVAKISKNWGVRVQYSLFVLWITPEQRAQLLKELEAVIHPIADDIRLYPLPHKPDWTHIGLAPFAEGITLYTAGGFGQPIEPQF